MAEDLPDIVTMTEVNPKGRSYKIKIEDIKILGYITFESNLSCVGRRGVAVLVHSSPEHSVSALEENTEFRESFWLNFKLQNGDNLLFDNVLKTLMKTNITKSCGPDELHPRMLKELAVELAAPMTELFNPSLFFGRSPRGVENGKCFSNLQKAA